MWEIMVHVGSGFSVEMSERQLMEDLAEGTEDTADRGYVSVVD